MQTIIGIAGVKESGKSTSAEMIKEIVNAKDGALADKLKNVCSMVFNIPRNYFDDQDIKEKPLKHVRCLSLKAILFILNSFSFTPNVGEISRRLRKVIDMELDTPRRIAQVVGTELLREFGGKDVHCNGLSIESNPFIVTDFRFPNEYEFFANNGDIAFIPLYIYRQIAEDKITKNSHSSETSVFEFKDRCLIVDNNKDLEHLRRGVHSIVRKVYLNE